MLAVIVNGLPGSGKSTLAPRLAGRLGLPLFSKDAVKETMVDVLGLDRPDRTRPEWNRSLGAAAMEVLWTLLGASPHGAVLESPLFPALTGEYVMAGLRRAGVPAGDLREVWCEVPPELARARYEARAAIRHPIHGDDRDRSADWALWSRTAAPLGFGRVYRVDTSAPVDDATVGELAENLGR